MISRELGICLASGCAAMATLAAIFWAELDKARARAACLQSEMDNLWDRYRRLAEQSVITEKRFSEAMDLVEAWKSQCDAIRHGYECPKQGAEVTD